MIKRKVNDQIYRLCCYGYYLERFSAFGHEFASGVQSVFVRFVALGPKRVHGLGDFGVHRSSIILAKVRNLRKKNKNKFFLNLIPIRHQRRINHSGRLSYFPFYGCDKTQRFL